MLVSQKKQKISHPSDIVPILQAMLKNADETDNMKEHFWCIGLNGQNCVQYVELVTLGLVNQCQVHPREVFSFAVQKRCCAIIVGHNHPSDNTEPSLADTEVTGRLKAAGTLLGIELLDHVIITENSFYSFAEHDLL